MTDSTSKAPATATAPAPTESPKPNRRPIPFWITIGGWYGVLALLGAYYGISLEIIKQGLIYQLLNITGAVGIALLCFKKRAWQPLVVNLAWVAIGLFASWKLII